ncbi:hypothetical protein BCU70_19390 [Vibrio sp. 10N.286.49.C2]|uniref:hypothetical protein n=1 Tax=unclassified Vibrio TaxID=2614977 RepID=UPI000C84DD2C|nr:MULTISPECIES: hypothetical protein [unclassified Vibrio]PMH34826.1 hypothetical protein BCU70_19390 [Vibrio sp. 10N.286.49.C2]PMH51386.1 hypothetical protein BCU66_16725 [Vibrio sp. 10N.286.49.B1]PMH83623.1 hypothetical protein BCU58_14130 [Vibrio sp. 10N.286.48.B7]
MFSNVVTANWVESFVGGHIDLVSREDLGALSDIYDCGETEGQYYCGFDLDYRGVPMDAKVSVNDDEISRVELIALMTPYHYTRIPFSLRVDGFELVEVLIGEQRFNVAEELAKHSAAETDKKLVEFLNLSPISVSKVFTWVRKNEIQDRLATETVCMKSDKEQISLVWMSNPSF